MRFVAALPDGGLFGDFHATPLSGDRRLTRHRVRPYDPRHN
jgi:hypothetical protein